MSTRITFNAVQYDVPDTGDVDWGDTVTALLIALASASSSTAGSRVRAKSAAQTFADGSADTLVFGTVDYDTLSEYASGTGIFTAKSAGYFHVSSLVTLAQIASPPVGTYVQMLLFQNASVVARGDHLDATGAPQILSPSLDTTVHLAQNDTLQVKLTVSTGGSGDSVSLFGSVQYNYLTVDQL